MSEIPDLIQKLTKLTTPNRWLDEHIATALGAQVRRVGRLGLNGRSRGSYRAFFPHHDPHGTGGVIPYYTKDAKSRSLAIRRLELALATRPSGENHD